MDCRWPAAGVYVQERQPAHSPEVWPSTQTVCQGVLYRDGTTSVPTTAPTRHCRVSVYTKYA